MALIFQRLAQNFIKNGYFPTDSETVSRIISALKFKGHKCNIIDPCCGEGTALAEIQHALKGAGKTVASYGVEYNEERAWHSKTILDHCIHGDIRNSIIGLRQFGLLFLNPPYGDGVSDKAQLSDPKNGRIRLEKEFYQLTNGFLQFNGILVLIIPYYVLDKELSTWISRHFHNVSIYMAPEKRFKQAIIFGVRHKVTAQWQSSNEYHKTRQQLMDVGHGDIEAEELPEVWSDHISTGDELHYYEIPNAEDKPKFELATLDGKQMSECLQGAGLWSQFDLLMNQSRLLDHKRPLCAVSDWHLALMLAAGQVSGVNRSKDGRVFVVRGNTHKSKVVSKAIESDGDGGIATISTHTDIFVPTIRGLDMTPGSETFGEVFTIK